MASHRQLRMLLSLLALVLAATLWAAGPAAAQDDDWDDDPDQEQVGEDGWDEELDGEESEVSDDVLLIEEATAELGRAKRRAASTLKRLSRQSSQLAGCMRGGPGWKRIRKIRNRSQRSLYTASARRLLSDMQLLLDRQQSRIAAYGNAFEGFVAELEDAELSDPVLSDAVAAQARRLSSYAEIARIQASCAVFNRLTKKVRELPTGTPAQIVRADYRATPIARRIQRYVEDRLRAIDRRHGISQRDVRTLEQAERKLVELGGEAGYATGFRYALSLR